MPHGARIVQPLSHIYPTLMFAERVVSVVGASGPSCHANLRGGGPSRGQERLAAAGAIITPVPRGKLRGALPSVLLAVTIPAESETSPRFAEDLGRDYLKVRSTRPCALACCNICQPIPFS
jgi:hypothetical protein